MKYKKITSLLLSLALISGMLALCPITAHAAQDGDWTYAENADGSCTITGYTGDTTVTEITVPDALGGLTVTDVAMSFSVFPNLETVNLYNTAAIAEMPSLNGCAGLTHVNSVYHDGTVIRDRLPNCVTSIPADAFAGTNLHTLTIWYVTQIGDRAFADCDNLSGVYFGRPAVIGVDAFSGIDCGCTVYYSYGSFTDWDYTAFRWSQKIIVRCNDGYCGWCGGADAASHNTLYWTLDSDGLLTIACGGDSYLTYPAEQVPTTAYWTIRLVKAVVTEHVYGLKFNQFAYYSTLESVTLGTGLAGINGGALRGCTALERVVMPATVTVIGYDAFNNSTALTNIFFDGTEAQWNAVTKKSGWNANLPAECEVHCRYTASVRDNDGNCAAIYPYDGETVSLTAHPAEGMYFIEWQVVSGDIEISDDTFIMPKEDVEIIAVYEQPYALNTDGNVDICLGFDRSEDTLTAAPRTYLLSVWLRDGALPDAGKYFTGELLLDGHVYGTPGEGEAVARLGNFIMPAEAVSVAAVQADTEALTIGMEHFSPVAVTKQAKNQLLGGVTMTYDPNADVYLIDLDGSGVFDVKLYTESGTDYAQRLADADAFAGSYTYSFNGSTDRYSAITFAAEVIGDVNRDGSVNVGDVTAIQQYLTDTNPLTAAQLLAADTNGDGTVDIADATCLQMYLAGYFAYLG